MAQTWSLGNSSSLKAVPSGVLQNAEVPRALSDPSRGHMGQQGPPLSCCGFSLRAPFLISFIH